MCRRSGDIGRHCSFFPLGDLLALIVGDADGIDREGDDLQTAAILPFCAQLFIQSGCQLLGMRGDLVVHDLLRGDLRQCRLQCAKKLALEHAVDLVTAVFAADIAADIRIEQERIDDLVGIDAVAAQVNGELVAQTLVNDDAERDRRGSAVFVVEDLLGVEIVNALILAGITAVGKTLADELEGLLDAVTQLAREDARLGGGIVCKFTGLCTDLNDLTLLDNDHALSVGDRDAGAVGDDVVTALRVGGTAADALLPLDHQNILVQCLTIEKFLPLVSQYAAQCAESCFNKSHN